MSSNILSNKPHDLIDPRLEQALSRWGDFSSESAQQSLILLDAITPLKDAAQVAGDLIDSMPLSEWPPRGSRLSDPAAISRAAGELIDIQMAAADKFYEGCRAFMETTQASAEQLAAMDRDVDSVQAWMAAYLDTSLDILKRYQADAGTEAASLNAIQSAYKAWYQKALQSLKQG